MGGGWGQTDVSLWYRSEWEWGSDLIEGVGVGSKRGGGGGQREVDKHSVVKGTSAGQTSSTERRQKLKTDPQTSNKCRPTYPSASLTQNTSSFDISVAVVRL